MKKIILVGGGEDIGRTIIEELGSKYSFVVVDKNTDNTKDLCESHTADASCYSELCGCLFGDADCLVILTGDPSIPPIMRPEDRNDAFYDTFIKSVYNCFYYAMEHNIQKVIYCSSNHVTGLLESGGFSLKPGGRKIDVMDRYCPDSLYGAMKACGEMMGELFSEKFGMTVFNFRIGTYRYDESRKADFERYERTWLFREDLVKCFDAAFQSLLTGCRTYYVVSDNQDCPWNTYNLKSELLSSSRT